MRTSASKYDKIQQHQLPLEFLLKLRIDWQVVYVSVGMYVYIQLHVGLTAMVSRPQCLYEIVLLVVFYLI